MSAYCAVCTLPLARGEPFALVRCYVVHQRCAGQRTQEERFLDDIRNKVALLDSELQRERSLNGTRMADLNFELIAANNRARNAERQLDRATMRIRELDLEAADLRRAPAPRAPVETPEPKQEISSEPVDDTSLRFRLLELE